MLALVGENGLTGNAGITLLQRPAVFVQVRVVVSCALGNGKPSAFIRRSWHPPTAKNDSESPKLAGDGKRPSLPPFVFHALLCRFPRTSDPPIETPADARGKTTWERSCRKSPRARENEFRRPRFNPVTGIAAEGNRSCALFLAYITVAKLHCR